MDLRTTIWQMFFGCVRYIMAVSYLDIFTKVVVHSQNLKIRSKKIIRALFHLSFYIISFLTGVLVKNFNVVLKVTILLKCYYSTKHKKVLHLLGIIIWKKFTCKSIYWIVMNYELLISFIINFETKKIWL